MIYKVIKILLNLLRSIKQKIFIILPHLKNQEEGITEIPFLQEKYTYL